MTDPPHTKARGKRVDGATPCSGDVAAWPNGQALEGVIRRSQADPALRQMLDELLCETIADLLASELEYRREFATLCEPGLAAMSKGDFVSAAPGPHFGPED